MIHQPVEIKQTLIDDVLVRGSFVFEDYRAAVFVHSECVDPTAVRCGELGREKPDAQQGFEILFEKSLDGLLNSVSRTGELIDLARADAEQLDVTHSAASASVPKIE